MPVDETTGLRVTERRRSSLAVVIITYNRPEYLSELLKSLIPQTQDYPVELVVIDNGSAIPVEPEIRSLISRVQGSAMVLRENENLMSLSRIERALDLVEADFILLPGDDDVLLPNYLATMSALAETSPDVMLIACGMSHIDGQGREIGAPMLPPEFPDEITALSSLLVRNPYALPASGFRKSAINLARVPPSRTAFDWWLWIQCWLKGRAAVSRNVCVQYRQHAGQEQRSYTRDEFELDGARMLASVVSSQEFHDALSQWSGDDYLRFATRILQSEGLNGGEPQWGPLLQLIAVQVLSDRLATTTSAELYAQASAHAGVTPTPTAISSFTRGSLPASLPRSTWSRVALHASWKTQCELSMAWRTYLMMPEIGRGRIRVTVKCSCLHGSGTAHTLRIEIQRRDAAIKRHLLICQDPSEAASLPLRQALDHAISAQGGLHTGSSMEQRIIRTYRKARGNRAFGFLERGYRRLLRR